MKCYKARWIITSTGEVLENKAIVVDEGKFVDIIPIEDASKFDEKYVKLIFYCISMNLKLYTVKSEMEVQREYPDILLVPRDRKKGYNSIMVEFKYLKKGEENKLKEKQKEAKEQILKYSNYEEIKDIEKLNKYTIIAVNDKLYVEKVDAKIYN